MTSTAAQYLETTLPERGGFHANHTQLRYAETIAKALRHPGAVHFSEASTGIGKTLAYLLAIGEWVAEGKAEGRRGVVSTHSRSLQRQLMSEENLAILGDYLESQGLPKLTIGCRMGRQNYVSEARLALHLGAASLSDVLDDPERSEAERALAEWAMDSDGCLMDLNPDLLPDGITHQDICHHSHDTLSPAVQRHFEAVKCCDIVVVNHSLLALDLVNGQKVTQARPPYALLLDEAEHFPEAAEQVLSQQISLRASVRLLRSMSLKAAGEWASLLESLTRPWQAGEVKEATGGTRDSIEAALEAITRARPRQHSYDANTWAEWRHFSEEAGKVLRQLQQGDRSRPVLVQFSPVQGVPRIVVPSAAAGACLKIGMDDRSTILTSATLSDMQHGPGEAPTFNYMRSQLVMGGGDSRIGTQEAFEPHAFGDLRFRLPEDMPGPLHQPQQGVYELAPTFAKRAITEILAARGRTLVLCPSYRDVAILQSYWPSDAARQPVTHASGTALNELAATMGTDDILLTPAGWEGLSPDRSNGEAFWSTIVILRNPRPAISSISRYMLEQRLHDAGMRRADAASMARRLLHRQGAIQAAHKLRQGIGRGIRHPEDRVEVIILDPRFPRPSGEPAGEGLRLARELVGAIPHRFMTRYREAGVPQTRSAAASVVDLV